ncbi:MAG: polysaccharide biosynthesis C-terminal domain-containing protein, partial [Gaiellales bacterium]
MIPVAIWFGPAAQLGLGHGYAACGVVALAMSPYLLLWGLAPILTMTASYAGLARRRVGAALLTVTVNVVLDLALIPRFGPVGAAIGTDVAFAIYVAAHVRLCRTIGLRLPSAHRA